MKIILSALLSCVPASLHAQETGPWVDPAQIKGVTDEIRQLAVKRVITQALKEAIDESNWIKFEARDRKIKDSVLAGAEIDALTEHGDTALACYARSLD